MNIVAIAVSVLMSAAPQPDGRTVRRIFWDAVVIPKLKQVIEENYTVAPFRDDMPPAEIHAPDDEPDSSGTTAPEKQKPPDSSDSSDDEDDDDSIDLGGKA